MEKFLLKSVLLIVCFLFSNSSLLAQSFSGALWAPEPTQDPYGDKGAPYPTYMSGEITEVTVIFPNAEDIELTGTDEAYITYSDGADYWGGELNLNEKTTVDGNKLTISIELTCPSWCSAAFCKIQILEGALKDKKTGETNKYIESETYVVTPIAVSESWISSNPATKANIVAFGPEVTLKVPGYTLTTSDATTNPARIKFTTSPVENFTDFPGDTSEIDFTGEAVSVAIENNAMVIDLGQTLSDAGWYCLRILDYDINVEDSEGNAISNPSDLYLYYHVAGYSVSPRDQSTMNSFPGLTITGPDVVITELDKINIYNSYIDESNNPLNNKDEEGNITTVATAISTSPVTSNGYEGYTINFNYPDGDLYNGSYTVFAPAGCITINGKSIGDFYLHFIITGNMMPLPEVSVDPIEGEVNELEVVNLAWGLTTHPAEDANTDFYGEFLNYNQPAIMEGEENVAESYIPATLTLPDGQTVDVKGYIKTAYIPNVDGDTGSVDTSNTIGGYLQFAFEPAYTEAGDYKLSIAANELYVSYNSYNQILNQAVSITYTIKSNGGTVGISAITEGISEESVIYNLQGQKVSPSKIHKGIYIINGKKVLIKD